MSTTSTYSIQQLKQDLQALLHGSSLDDINNPNDIINRAGRDLLADADLMETKRVYQFAGGVFDSETRAYNYLLPADLKLDKVIDIRPQINRGASNNFVQHTSKEFDLYKAVDSVSIDDDTGLKYIRISTSVSSPVLFNDFEAVSGANGTNSASGIVTTLAADTIYKVNGGGSLSFNITGSGTGYVENSTLAAVDLTNYKNAATAFVWVYIPSSPSTLTNINFRWGSSSANYYSVNATTNFWSQAFVTGWNLVSFSWPTSATGSPTITAINYMRVTFTWTGAAVNAFRIDDLFFALPSIYEMVYYSKYIFQDSTGAFKENCSVDTDYVNLDTDSYNLLLYKTAELAGLQLQKAIPLRGKLINFDQQVYGGLYDTALKRYKENYRSEASRRIGTYYRNRYIRQR